MTLVADRPRGNYNTHDRQTDQGVTMTLMTDRPRGNYDTRGRQTKG